MSIEYLEGYVTAFGENGGNNVLARHIHDLIEKYRQSVELNNQLDTERENNAHLMSTVVIERDDLVAENKALLQEIQSTRDHLNSRGPLGVLDDDDDDDDDDSCF